MAVEHLLRVEGICFDAVYTRVQTLKKSDEYCNYNQIYTDFEITPRDQDLNVQGDLRIQEKVILVAPICLTHEEIKSSEDEALILMESSEILEEDTGQKFSNKLTVRGLPIESQQYVPLNFLVPHLMQQNFLYAISFTNISNILVSLLMAGW